MDPLSDAYQRHVVAVFGELVGGVRWLVSLATVHALVYCSLA